MPSQRLTSHLSYKSALVLLPPAAIIEPIQTIRHKFDKQFHRWPPHINLIYPFRTNLAETQSDVGDGISCCLRQDVLGPIEKIANETKPFRVILSSKPRHFQHRKRSTTVWLEPIESTAANEAGAKTIHSLRGLQTRLQAEFADCNADKRPFIPHLSVGQCAGHEESVGISSEVERILTSAASYNKGDQSDEPGLDWYVDCVYVIGRKGFEDPFTIVGEVPLGGNPKA